MKKYSKSLVELRTKHMQLRALLDNTPAVIYRLRLDGEKILPQMANENITMLQEFAATETLSYEWWLEHLHPEDRERAAASISETLAHETSRTEYRLRHKDGSYRWVEDNRRLVRDGRSEPVEIVGLWTDITERRRAEAAIKQYTEIIESTDDAIISQTLEGKITSWNPAAERMFGYSAPEIIGSSAQMLIPPDRVEEEAAMLARIKKGEHVRHFEKVLLCKDGSRLDVSVTVSPFRDAGEKIVGATRIVRNITGRKQAGESLLLLRALIDRSSDGIEVIDPDTGRFLDINETTCEQLGYSREEMLSMAVPDIETTSGTKSSWQAVMEKIRESGFKIVEGRHRRKDGSTFPVEINVRYIRLNRDYLVAVVRDITGRKASEQQIRQLSQAVEQSPISIIITDTKGDIQYVNPKFTAITGYSFEEVVGKNSRVMKSGETPPETYKVLWDTITAGREWHGELHNLKKNGELFWESVFISAIKDNNGVITNFLAVKEDITEYKQLTAQFLRAQRMENIGMLASGIAHDLNNILAPIMMSMEVLKETSHDPQSMSILETIEVSAQRGADIVRQILSFARGIEGQRVEVQPKHLLKDIENVIKSTFPKNIRVQLSAPFDTWTILGDPTQLLQVLMNLCVNARDAMPDGGLLSINVENRVLDEQYATVNIQAKPGSYVIVSVVDSGMGMSPDVLEKIFDPFFTTKAIGKGTGLGLSTVMAIMKSHGGFINVYSEPGKGTTFRLHLPTITFSQSGSGSKAELDLPRGNGETVLIIDDEASILTIASQTLQAFGYRVLTANNGATAMKIYAQHQNEIAVALTDMMMPVMDGRVTIQALKQMNPAVKIIAASGLDANTDVSTLTGAGVLHFLPKPYTAETLLKILRTVLDEA